MNRKRKAARPADPMAIARRRAEERLRDRDPANWGVDGAALGLVANADVTVSVGVAGKIGRARRSDVFDLMAARGRLDQRGLGAVRRLQEDIAILHRTATGGRGFDPRVDGSPDPQGFTDARLRTGARVKAVLDLAGTASARLLAALCEPPLVLGASADWRAVVARVSGETLPDAQGATLRAACENLAGAYAAIDRAKRRAA